jgi:ligand-binding SRPBCC domain-containing protein
VGSLVRSSRLSAAPDEVWERVVSPAGINDELRPLIRMTVPKAMRGRSIDDVQPGDYLGRSWILLFGVIPFDYDELGLAELGPGRRFLERSKMLSMRSWEHERTVTPVEGGCEVTDRVAFEPRALIRLVPGLSSLVEAALRRMFAHRHRRLGRRFGSLT